ncbi:SRPBCC family protein [Paenibacillus gyeongsangnamensis]|uniref:SRPBCC family protein n=1 Tax=Paenibacillus gyeongsangnamensis TaxID=3388067 RepID=UPI003907F173
MNSYECYVDFTAPLSKVYEALTTTEGLRGWWTSDCDVSTQVGQVSTSRFGETFNQMRIEALEPNNLVHWYCIGQYHHADELTIKDEWKGTNVIFTLSKNDIGGAVRLNSRHRLY